MIEELFSLSRPLSLKLTLGSLQRGRRDPCVRFDDAGLWWGTRTPEGTATLLLRVERDTLRARAWGDGAEHVLRRVPELVGEHQNEVEYFSETAHPKVADLHKRLVGMRVPKTSSVMEALFPSILEQRVTGMEAKGAYRQIVRWLGEPAPGPRGSVQLMVSPSPKKLAETPAWAFHRFGVEAKRANAIRSAAMRARRVEEAATLPHKEARERLCAIPGVGPWTAAEVAYLAFGDSDAVSIGDFHIHDYVVWALAGEPRGDDRRMLELLEPFRTQRGRVQRLITAGHPMPPKYGPRYTPIPIATL